MAKIAVGIGEIAFVALQPDADTLKKPTSDGTVLLISIPEGDQEPKLAKNKEMREGLGENADDVVGFNLGTGKLSMNFKLSGVPGELSPYDPLFLSWYGNRTVTPGVSVAYTPYKNKQALNFVTVLIKKDTEVHLWKSAVVSQGDINVKAAEFQTLQLSLLFKQLIVAGTSATKGDINGTAGDVTAIELENPEAAMRYDVGCYITIGTDDNAGEGFQVTAINETTGTLTVTPAVKTDQTSGSVVCGWAPVPAYTGENLIARRGKTTMDYGASGVRDFNFTEAGFSCKNGMEGADDVVSMAEFPLEITNTSTRTTTFKSTRYYGLTESELRTLRNNQTPIPITLYIGNEPGKSIEVVMPDVRLSKASASGDKLKKASIEGKCAHVIAEDESTLILK